MTLPAIFQALILALSAWLFVGPLSEPGQIFASLTGRIKSLLAKPGKDPEGWRYIAYQWLSCPKCATGIVALIWQGVLLTKGEVSLWGAYCFWVLSVAIAAVFEREYK